MNLIILIYLAYSFSSINCYWFLFLNWFYFILFSDDDSNDDVDSGGDDDDLLHEMCDGLGGEESEPVGPHGGLLSQEEEAIAALLTFSISGQQDCPPTEE